MEDYPCLGVNGCFFEMAAGSNADESGRASRGSCEIRCGCDKGRGREKEDSALDM